MNCPDCDRLLTGITCTCGYQPKALAVEQHWVIQVCSRPGCCVDIRVKAGEQADLPVCKWCQAGTAYNTRPHPLLYLSAGEALSKEEFGLDLFEAIRLQTAMREAFKTAALYRAKRKERAAKQAERAVVDLQKQLETILKKNTIAPEDLQRLLAIT